MDMTQALPYAVAGMPCALSVIDFKARLLFYNDYASKILNRKPEMIGKDIRDCHELKNSKDKITLILEQYEKGETKEYSWQVSRDGKTFFVKVAPFVFQETVKGLLHVAMLIKE